MTKKIKKVKYKGEHTPALIKKGFAIMDEEGRMSLSEEGKKRKEMLELKYKGAGPFIERKKLEEMLDFVRKPGSLTKENFEKMWELLNFISFSSRPINPYAWNLDQKEVLKESLRSPTYVIAYNAAEQACSLFYTTLKTFLQLYRGIKDHWKSRELEFLKSKFPNPEKAAFSIASSNEVPFLRSGYIADLKFFLSEMENSRCIERLKKHEKEIAEWEKEHPRWDYPFLKGKSVKDTSLIQFYIPYEHFKKKYEDLMLLLGKLEALGMTLESLEKILKEEEQRPSARNSECIICFELYKRHKWYNNEV